LAFSINGDNSSLLREEKDIIIPEKQKFILPEKQRKSYRNILGGLYKATLTGEQVKFVTYTTSDECKNQSSFNSNTLSLDYRLLNRQIKRLKPQDLIDNGYITNRQSGQYYGAGSEELKVFENLQYFKVHTSEGNGVIHSVMRSPYIPFEYISDVWMDLHLTWNINIQNIQLDKYSPERTASYIVAQYCSSKQGSDYLYSSQSKNWVYTGANKEWKDLVKMGMRDTSKYHQYHINLGKGKSGVIKWCHPYFEGKEAKKNLHKTIEKYHEKIQKSTIGNYSYPPEKKHPNDLTELEEDNLHTEVLNCLYRDSRLNPFVSMNKDRPNIYHDFVEKRIGQNRTEKDFIKFEIPVSKSESEKIAYFWSQNGSSNESRLTPYERGILRERRNKGQQLLKVV